MTIGEYFTSRMDNENLKIPPCISCGILVNRNQSYNVCYGHQNPDRYPESFFPHKVMLYPYQCQIYNTLYNRHNALQSLQQVSASNEELDGQTLMYPCLDVSQAVQKIIPDTKSLWICATCDKHLKSEKWLRNMKHLNLYIPPPPTCLLKLNSLQKKLIALQQCFMRVFRTHLGCWGLHGGSALIPIDLESFSRSVVQRALDSWKRNVGQIYRHPNATFTFMESIVEVSPIVMALEILKSNHLQYSFLSSIPQIENTTFSNATSIDLQNSILVFRSPIIEDTNTG